MSRRYVLAFIQSQEMCTNIYQILLKKVLLLYNSSNLNYLLRASKLLTKRDFIHYLMQIYKRISSSSKVSNSILSIEMTHTTRRFLDDFFPFCIFGLTALLTVLLLLGIFVFLLITGIGAFAGISPKDFFFGTNCDPTSYHTASWGILSLVVGTCLVRIVALCIAVPFVFCMAVYLSEILNRHVVKEI